MSVPTPADPWKDVHMASLAPDKVRHVAAKDGRSFAIFGSIITFKDEPKDNGDAFLMFEHRERPESGVLAHREPNHESWYVLEGTLEVDVEGTRYRLGPGDFLSVPPGVVHALHNPGPGWMRVLTTVSPGASHARFFSAVGEPVEDLRNPPTQAVATSVERLMAAARECGIEFLPPDNQG
jgi:quercetin dioxygenase-like cupin family protein